MAGFASVELSGVVASARCLVRTFLRCSTSSFFLRSSSPAQ
ncbi:hypothetical protein GQ607_013761 [Colletotrichum asianum]|uniref:Uncharacterized protein n=1 Tax=Colletotrichum asianum TaxID=702518 RepID=A0A8H3ZKE2_9PEZI|nr:hypothetical protein GQ607_013761 [Colletotrichum asianum]